MYKNTKKIKEILNSDELTILEIIDLAVPIADLLSPCLGSPSQKFDNRYFLTCLFDFVQRCVSWRKYKGTHECPIKGKYLNTIHNRYVDDHVYEAINEQLKNKYLMKGREQKLKYQSIDSSFIPNKGGSVKNNNHLLSDRTKRKNNKIKSMNEQNPTNKQKKEETFIDYNKYNGRKKYFKISVLTDSYGVPLTSTIIQSKESDNISLIKTINGMSINLNTLKNSKINRYKQYLLADSGYDSHKNKRFLKKLGYTPVIKYNKRNTKDKTIIKKNKFTKEENKIYKKRSIIESFFSWIKNFPVINQNYQKTVKSYNGLLLLASSILISKKI